MHKKKPVLGNIWHLNYVNDRKNNSNDNSYSFINSCFQDTGATSSEFSSALQDSNYGYYLNMSRW